MSENKARLLVAIFLIGFSSLVYQTYSVHVLFMFFVQSSQAVSIAMSAFLGGIALSSLIFSRITNQNSNNVKIIYWLQLVAALYGYFLLSQYDLIPSLIDGVTNSDMSELLKEILKASVVWIFLFIPAFFLGGAFPLVNGLYLKSLKDASKDTGVVYFWDTLGAIIGALLTGYLLLPHFGVLYTILIPVFLNLFVCLLLCNNRKSEVAVLAILLMVLTIESLSYLNLDLGLRDKRETLEERFGKVVFQKESPFGKVTISGDGKKRTLFINYRQMCDLGFEDSNEAKIGTNAAILAPAGSKALNIGLGCGFTAASIIEAKNVKHLDVVEINPVIFEATSNHMKNQNGDVTNRDDVQIILQEGYDFLRNTDKTYGVIVVDIEEPTIVHSSALFKKEFFEVVDARLQDNGIFALWSFEANPEFSRVIYNTLKSVFPYVVVDNNGPANNFYASKKLNAAMMNLESKLYTEKMMGTKINEINTIAKPDADKYFDLNKVFGLPANYVDEFDNKHSNR